MASPPDEPLDSAWDDEEGAEDPDSTRRVDSRELFARAGFKMDEAPAGQPPDQGGDQGTDSKITVPPPVPEDEYVARMMEVRSRSSQEIPSVPRAAIPWKAPQVADDFEGTLGALLSEQQVGLDCDEPGVLSAPGLDFGVATVASAEISLDDLSEELSIEPPPPLPAKIDALDEIDSPHPSPAPRPGGAAAVPRPPAAVPRPPAAVPRPAAAPRPAPRASAPSAEEPSIDFRLDLGFEVPDLAVEEPPPATPPPGTLRYGLVDDEPELDVYGTSAPPPAGPARPAVLRTLPSPAMDARPDQPPASTGRHAKIRLRFDAGDYSGALVLAEALLDEEPGDEAARSYAESCNEMLRQMYKARIGDGAQVLRVVISKEEMRSLSLDHRAGFLLSCIDGYSSVDEILDVSGMAELEALRILYELVQADVIRCSPR
ncbi:MAG: hypothetical protein IT372_20565 [Polyangiaceae bacterium]|nr:hypothetical protein [Polyangiaceae bacterium]